MLIALLFLLSAGAIYLACEYFVNGVEWFGQKLSLGATATGTVLAAFGTALPESAVTFVAVVFGKTPEQSLMAIARLDQFGTFGLPLLVGASRKRFISSISPSEPHQRLGGSIAAHLIAAKRGARIIRTHDVYDTVQALRVAEAVWEKA